MVSKIKLGSINQNYLLS